MRAGGPVAAPARTEGEPKPLTRGDWRFGLKSGETVIVRMDNGTDFWTVVRTIPWLIPSGHWLVGLVGLAGGYSLERVLRRADRGDACGRTVRAEAVQAAGKAGVQAVRGLPLAGQGVHAAEARVQAPRAGVVPAGLADLIQDWLRANELDPAAVQWGLFPIGMVNRWVERALEAEGKQSS